MKVLPKTKRTCMIPQRGCYCAELVVALRELGFAVSDAQGSEVARGKDFIQLENGPFDLDLIFAPDGIERFTDAWRRRVAEFTTKTRRTRRHDAGRCRFSSASQEA